MARVFISYSSTDRVYVEKLAAHLESQGATVWFDHHLDTGENWLEGIKREIETCDVMVVVMTPRADSSPARRRSRQRCRRRV